MARSFKGVAASALDDIARVKAAARAAAEITLRISISPYSGKTIKKSGLG